MGITAFAASAGEQLRGLRDQVGALTTSRAVPAASAAPAPAPTPLQQLLSYLPLIADYGGVAMDAFRRTRGEAAQPVKPRKKALSLARFARPAVITAVALGGGYMAYRLMVRQPSASPQPTSRSIR